LTHHCPKCDKDWKCLTDDLFDHLLGHGQCDLPKNSKCYACSGMPEMKELHQVLISQLKQVGNIKKSFKENILK